MYYHANASRLRYAPLYIQLAAAGGIALIGGAVCAVTHIRLAPSPGTTDMLATINGNMAALALRASNCALLVAVMLLAAAVLCYRRMPDTVRLCGMVRQALYQPSHGNPLHLRDGDLLPKVSCKCVGPGLYRLILSAQQSVSVNTLVDAAPVISEALNSRYQRYAITQTDADIAFRAVTFIVENVLVDRSLTYHTSAEMTSDSPTMLRVDQVTNIDLTTSGSMLVAGKTRSGKTTGVISLLIQALSCGPDDYGSNITIIDPKCAELSRLPHTVALDNDGEATSILDALKAYADTIKQRQKILNDLSEQTGDAVKWWDANFHPSFLFLDEYVSCRAVLPKKAAKDSNYCLDTFDSLIKRIVTTGASAGCYMIISIAEASVQEGGLPAMLRSAMSTKILFRPTLTEGRLMWDSEKLSNFSTDRVYGPGDAWFSSTDGMHDAISYVHFPRMEFPVYKELGRLLQNYYDDRAAVGAAQRQCGVCQTHR